MEIAKRNVEILFQAAEKKSMGIGIAKQILRCSIDLLT